MGEGGAEEMMGDGASDLDCCALVHSYSLKSIYHMQ